MNARDTEVYKSLIQGTWKLHNYPGAIETIALLHLIDKSPKLSTNQLLRLYYEVTAGGPVFRVPVKPFNVYAFKDMFFEGLKVVVDPNTFNYCLYDEDTTTAEEAYEELLSCESKAKWKVKRHRK